MFDEIKVFCDEDIKREANLVYLSTEENHLIFMF